MVYLPLPLHCYDEAGRIIPSSWFNLMFLWGARGLFLLAASVMLGPRGEVLPSLFFPLSWQLWTQVLLGGVYISLWLVTGRREWFWQRNLSLAWLKTSILMVLLCDIAVQCVAIGSTQGAFSWLRGLTLLITLFVCGYILRSMRTRLMFKDWSTPGH